MISNISLSPSLPIEPQNNHRAIDWIKHNILHALPYGHALTQSSWLKVVDAALKHTAGLAGMQAGMELSMSLRMSHDMPNMPHLEANHGSLGNDAIEMAAMAAGGSAGQIAYNIVSRGIIFVVHKAAQLIDEGGAIPVNNVGNMTDWVKKDVLLELPYAQALMQTQTWPEAFDSAAEYTTMLIGMFAGMKLNMPSGHHMSHSSGWVDRAKSMAAMAVGESVGMMAYNIARRGIGPAVYEAIRSLYFGGGPEARPLLPQHLNTIT